jgi:hypothetical protein
MDLVSRLVDAYVVEPEDVEAYLDHARTVRDEHGIQTDAYDTAVREAEIIDSLYTERQESALQSRLSMVQGLQSVIPLCDVHTEPSPRLSTRQGSAGRVDDGLEAISIEYDLGVFHGQQDVDNPSYDERLDDDRDLGELLTHTLGEGLITSRTAGYHHDLMTGRPPFDIDTGSRIAFGKAYIEPRVERSTHHMDGVPTAAIDDADKQAFSSYLNERVAGMMEEDAGKVDVEVYAASNEDGNALTQFRDLLGRLREPVSNSFKNVFLSAQNVHDVSKCERVGSRTRERGRRRVAVNEAYRHGSVSDAVSWHEQRAKQFGDQDHIEPFKERSEYHSFVKDALQHIDSDQLEDDVVPFRP